MDSNNSSGFLVHLISNAPSGSDVENRANNFSTITQQNQQLHGEWEVALTEIQYPNTWFNVPTDVRLMTYFEYRENESNPSGVDWCDLPAGEYTSVPRLLELIKSMVKILVFTYNETTGKITISHDNSKQFNWVKLIMTLSAKRFFALLGFDFKEQSITLPVEATHKPSLSVHHPALFVYSNIVEHQYVGNIMAPLLRIIPIARSKQDYSQERYGKDRQYVGLRSGYINPITIEIKDDTGEFLTFESGKVIVVLHFRPRRL